MDRVVARALCVRARVGALLLRCACCTLNASQSLRTLHSNPQQELQALIKYIQMNKESDTDWFTIAPEDGGKKWRGKCWCAALVRAAAVFVFCVRAARARARMIVSTNHITPRAPPPPPAHLQVHPQLYQVRV
jgi:hypothetical protein